MSTELSGPEQAPGRDALADERRGLKSACRKALKRLQTRLDKQSTELVAATDWLHCRQTGETILAHLRELKRGQTECTLQNVHTGQTETIALNPTLTPQENAEMYFRKAKKGKRGLEVIEQHVTATKREIAAIQTIAGSLDLPAPEGPVDEAALAAELDLFRKQLSELDVLPRQQVPGRSAEPEERIPYRHLVLDGWDIFIGKNDAQNDELSTRFAKPWDIWLHVAAHAGSHVVIRRPKNTPWPPKRIVETAAAFAVWFSKAKHTTYSEVHVAERRFVRKRHGAPAGQVIVEQFKTVRVAPRNPQEFFKQTGDDDKSEWD